MKKKPFKRFAAYVRKYGSWSTAEITSLAEDGKSAQAVSGKKRTKIDWRYRSGPEIYPVNEHNTELFNFIATSKKEVERLQSEIHKAESKMKPWKPEE